MLYAHAGTLFGKGIGDIIDVLCLMIASKEQRLSARKYFLLCM